MSVENKLLNITKSPKKHGFLGLSIKKLTY